MKAIDQLQAPAVAAINGRFQNIPVKVRAGPHKIGVTFIARSHAESDEVLYSFKPGALEERIPRVGSVEVVGPFNPAGIGDTPSRARIFVCRPASERDPSTLRPFDTLKVVPSKGERRCVQGKSPARWLSPGRSAMPSMQSIATCRCRTYGRWKT